MAQIVLNLPTFVLTSTWSVANTPEGYRKTTPTTHSLNQIYSLSAIPSGAIINNATLYAEREWADTGAAVDKVNDSTWDENLGGWKARENITALVKANAGGSITINYKWKANGHTNPPAGQKRAQIHYKIVTLTIDYTPASSTGTLSKTYVQMNGVDTLSLTISPTSGNAAHVVTWRVNGSGDIVENLNAGITQAELIVPLSWNAHVANAVNASASATIETILDGSVTGTRTYYFTANVPANLTPSLNPVINAIDAFEGLCLKGITKAKIVPNAQGSYGSTISFVQYTGAGQVGNGNEEWTSAPISDIGNHNFTVQITDSRGRAASATVPFDVVDYAPPNLDASVFRLNTSQQLDPLGVKAGVKARWQAHNIGSNAITSAKAWLREAGGSWGLNADLSFDTLFVWQENIATTKEYELKVEVTDKVGIKTSWQGTIPKAAEPLFDFRPDKAAIGCPAGDAGTLSFPPDWRIVGGIISPEYQIGIEQKTPYRLFGKVVYAKYYEALIGGDGDYQIEIDANATLIVGHNSYFEYNGSKRLLPYIVNNNLISNIYCYTYAQLLVFKTTQNSWGNSLTVKGLVYYIKD